MRNADAMSFLVSGQRHHRFVLEALERNGIEADSLARVLDFGCGCGRVLRWWWPSESRKLYGCDVNGKLARWCDTYLPGIEADENPAVPPTRYASESFDLVYSISIFTHLPRERQQEWMDELVRVTAPGGYILFTVAGVAYRDQLTESDRRRFDRGELIVHFDEAPGSNLCAVYHPPQMVIDELAQGLEVVDVLPGNPVEQMRQDSYLLRRPDGWRPRRAENGSAVAPVSPRIASGARLAD